MKSDVITITSKGEGFEQALEETRKVAADKKLDQKSSLHLTLFTEELLSLVRMLREQTKATFWIETDAENIDLHLNASMTMDKQKRAQLINASTTQKNEAANTLLGKIRDAFEQALTPDPEKDALPFELELDVFSLQSPEPEWGEFECSILRKLADDVKVSIRGSVLDMVVRKTFREQA